MLKRIINFVEKKTRNLYDSFKLYNQISKDIIKHENANKNIFLFDIPEHGNLGDHAIVIAEREFLDDNFPDNRVYEIPSRLSSFCSLLLKPLMNNSMILITGGGNMGTLWFHHEKIFRKIIKNNTNNPIIFFPQTMFYEKSKWGEKELEKSKKIYRNHKFLYLFAREEKTYKQMKKTFFNNNVYLVPDIVTYLNKNKNSEKRSGIIMCMRKDKESVLDKFTDSMIKQLSNEKDIKITTTDTVLLKNISSKSRTLYVDKKLLEFNSAELVITDRLHGMLFAAITGTPCICLDNLSGKVKGVYKWIDHLDYIKFADNVEDIPSYFEELLEKKTTNYDNNSLYDYFELIKKPFFN